MKVVSKQAAKRAENGCLYRWVNWRKRAQGVSVYFVISLNELLDFSRFVCAYMFDKN